MEQNISKTNKKISVAIILLAVLITCIITIHGVWDSDFLCIVANGREILSNGIFHKNPFFINKEFDIVVEQWLYCVIAGMFDKIGYAGYYLFNFLNIGILFSVSFLYLSQYKIKTTWKIICFLFIFSSLSLTIGSTRPEAITIALLMLVCYSLERFNKTDNLKWLILLPITMLLESNLHSAMIWFHFAVILAYIVPFKIKDKKINNGLQKKIKPIIIFTVISFAVAFINPYGINGVMYLFNSVFSGTFRYTHITELQPLLGSTNILLIIAFCACFMFLIYLWQKGKIKNHHLYLTIGFGAFAIFQFRNSMFLYVVLFTMVPYLFEKTENYKFEYRTSKKNHLPLLLCMLDILLGVYLFSVLMTDFAKISNQPQNIIVAEMIEKYEGLDIIDSYIEDKEGSRDINVFTGFNTGKCFEYFGYTNIYIDSRPELYMKRINNYSDVLPFYAKLAGNVKAPNELTYDELCEFLESYDFKYIVIEDKVEEIFKDYMTKYSDELGYKTAIETERYTLYEK